MAKVIAIVNQKGGVGKTTSTINLGACFARKGERVLLIDMDGQGNMSRGLGCKVKRNQYTIRDALVDTLNGVDADPAKGIVPAKYDPLYIMPANKQLLAFERSLKNEPEAPYLLRKYLEKQQWSFDHILIDCSPSLGVLTQNALVGSNSVMIPVDPEFFGVEGVEQITSTMSDVQRKMNPSLYLEGIVIVKRNNVSIAKRTNAENLRLRYEDKVYKTELPTSVKASEAQAHGIQYKGKDAIVTIPDGVTTIGELAFYENKTIKKVIIPDSVTQIKKAAFQWCRKLQEVGSNTRMSIHYYQYL